MVTQQKDRATTTNGTTQKKDNIPVQEGQAGGDIPDTPGTIEPTQSRPPKRMVVQTGGACKKMKVHKEVPEYTITKDDAELVTERVQDHTIEEYEEEEKQRERIMQELTEVRKVLEKIDYQGTT
jgi:hypothetical protein